MTVIPVTVENVSASIVIKEPSNPIIVDVIFSPFLKVPRTVLLSTKSSNGNPKFNWSVMTLGTARSTNAVAPERTPVTWRLSSKEIKKLE